MTEDQFTSLMYYTGIIQGVAMACEEPLRIDLLGVAIGLSNLANQMKKGEENDAD